MANQTRQLSELLKADGATVVMVPTNPPYRPAFVARWRGVRALFRLMPYFAALWRTSGCVDLLHVMANSGWSWHLFSVPAILVGRLRGVPVVINYRGGEAARFLGRSAWWVRWAMRRTAALIVPSAFLQRVFSEHGMAATVVPNVIDLDRFVPAVQAVQDELVVVTRNLEAIYGIDTALMAFAQVRRQRPSARLAIAGSGPDEASLRAMAESMQLGESVQFTGRLDRDAVAALYRRARVALNPSRVDNMPNSVLEAMACALPVVSTDVGGVRYIVEDDRTALLVPSDDPERMALAVLRLLQEATLHRRLAEAGLKEVRRYAWPQVSPILLAVYHGVLRQAPRQVA